MKILVYLILSLILVSSSCAGTNKRLRKNKKTTVEVVTKSDKNTLTESAAPIKEVEERLVPDAEGVTNIHHYFVIIGSFRNPENAKNYKEKILKEGFSSEILKNEEGLYRVSVLATDDINVARDDIKRIRNIFPKYSDTWVLIQKK
jgi:cell division protein FtsN